MFGIEAYIGFIDIWNLLMFGIEACLELKYIGRQRYSPIAISLYKIYTINLSENTIFLYYKLVNLLDNHI